MYKVYGDITSGNCYKVKLVMSLLDIAHEWINVDFLQGATRTPAFLAMNPNGRIPVLEINPGIFLSESNAILHYLAEGSHLLPSDRLSRARILSWCFFEQYSHEPNIAVARYIARYLGLPDDRRADYVSRHKPGYAALCVMEQQLESSPYLAGDQYTIADIALYAYTHVANEGGFDLSGFSCINAWLKRISSHPRHVAMY